MTLVEPCSEKISIIIPVKGKDELTVACLESIQQHSSILLGEILIVDNSETDQTKKMLAPFGWDKVRRVPGAPNLNFSQACNLGAKNAAGDTLLFLNNDITVSDGWLETVTEPLEKGAGIAGATLLYPDGKIQHGGEVLPLWGIPFIGGTGALGDDPRYRGVKERWAVIAACLAVSRDLFNKIGGFDEEYEFGLEDVDFCLKARDMGEEVVCVGDVKIVHHESGTIGKLPSGLIAERHGRNLDIFQKRWSGLTKNLVARYLNRMREDQVKDVAIFGTGTAAKKCYDLLSEGGFSVPCFFDNGSDGSREIDGIPVVRPDSDKLKFDCVLLASQYQWKMEEAAKETEIYEMVRSIELEDKGFMPGAEYSN